MDLIRYYETLFKISAVVGKNDALLADISHIVDTYDHIDILIHAINAGAHTSVIEFLADHIYYYDETTYIYLQHVYGIRIVIYNKGLYEYLNILYQSRQSMRSYYKDVAAILGYDIIMDDDERLAYIDKLLDKSYSYFLYNPGTYMLLRGQYVE